MGAPATSRVTDDPYDQAAAIVRDQDRDRYIANLFVAEPARKHLFALYAFNVEIARIRDVVSDPMLGEIRLQWWRDAILDDAGGGHPVATALIRTMQQFALPPAAFERALEARIFDLYDDPMPTLNDLEGYAGDTASSLIQMAAIVLSGGEDPGTAEAAGHAGVAYAITGLLRTLPRNARRNQTFLPKTMMESRGIDPSEIAAGSATPAVRSLLRDLRTIARQHLAQAERALAEIDLPVRAAFLPLSLVRPYLDRMDRDDAQPFVAADLAPWRRQWLLWRAARAM